MFCHALSKKKENRYASWQQVSGVTFTAAGSIHFS